MNYRSGVSQRVLLHQVRRKSFRLVVWRRCRAWDLRITDILRTVIGGLVVSTVGSADGIKQLWVIDVLHTAHQLTSNYLKHSPIVLIASIVWSSLGQGVVVVFTTLNY